MEQLQNCFLLQRGAAVHEKAVPSQLVVETCACCQPATPEPLSMGSMS